MSDEAPVKPSARGIARFIYLGLGVVFVALGYVGIVLPILPTTPFLLLACYFFARSSPRLNRWLLNSRLFGPFLRDWQEKRAIRRRVKWTVLIIIPIVIGTSAYFGRFPLPVLIALLILGAIGWVVVYRLAVIIESPPPSNPNAHDSPNEDGM